MKYRRAFTKIAPFTKVAQHERIDMCWRWRKSLHLAALMRNKGQLLAYIEKQIKIVTPKVRAGVKIIQSNLLKKDTELPENKKRPM